VNISCRSFLRKPADSVKYALVFPKVSYEIIFAGSAHTVSDHNHESPRAAPQVILSITGHLHQAKNLPTCRRPWLIWCVDFATSRCLAVEAAMQSYRQTCAGASAQPEDGFLKRSQRSSAR
jgi:hypothetical protein